ncbi:hypothetical protein JCM10212_002258 [Sporobolomyces blumeae]
MDTTAFASPPRPFSASPHLAEAVSAASANPLNSYSFPPAPPRTADGLKSGLSPPTRTSPRRRSRTAGDDSQFSFRPPPPAHVKSEDDILHRVDESRPHSSGAAIPSIDVDESHVRANHLPPLPSFPVEYSTLARTIVRGGDAREVVSSFAYSQFVQGGGGAGEPTSATSSLPTFHRPRQDLYDPTAPPQYPSFPQYRHQAPAPSHAPSSFARPAAPSSSYSNGPRGPPVGWAKPREPRDDPHFPRLAFPSFPTPSHPSSSSLLPWSNPHSHSMARTTSNQSGVSSTTAASSSSSSYFSNGHEYPDLPHLHSLYAHDHHVNPAYIGGLDGYRDRPDALSLWSASGPSSGPVEERDDDGNREPALSSVASLALDEDELPDPHAHRSVRSTYSGDLPASSSTRSRRARSARVPRVKLSPSESNNKRRVTSNIFHPSPQSMLAPGAIAPNQPRRTKNRLALGSYNSPDLPSDAEFATMPTKKSRGRRPPTTPALGIDVDLVGATVEVEPNGVGTADDGMRGELASYAGVTKTGRPKKVFFCKVPDCGKVFKRSEHLKRHVRSIHTNDRPFQCQWPGCAKFFSRHDNLNQHLRVHREPGVTDDEFSAALAACFNRRLQEVEAESAALSSGNSVASSSLGGGTEPNRGHGPGGAMAFFAEGLVVAGEDEAHARAFERLDTFDTDDRRFGAGGPTLEWEGDAISRSGTHSNSNSSLVLAPPDHRQTGANGVGVSIAASTRGGGSRRRAFQGGRGGWSAKQAAGGTEDDDDDDGGGEPESDDLSGDDEADGDGEWVPA